MSSAYVKSDIINHIATVEFFHPSHNSLPGDILNQLAEAITAAGNDNAVKVIILRSGGERTFCAGASFPELMAIQNETEGLEFFSGFAKVINACRTCPKLIIGRVQGKAVGGGVGVASAVDYCFATKYAAIKLSELHIGIGPFVVGPGVERKIGVSAMAQLAINANAFQSAEWARDKGLYAEDYESAEAMDEAILAFATQLAGYNPEAATELKRIFWEGTEHWDTLLPERAAVSGRLVLSEQTREILAKYK